MASHSGPSAPRRTGSFLSDTRVLQALAQFLAVAALVAAGLYLTNNVSTNLANSNIPFGWGFLRQTAGFEIAEGPPFDPTESYWRAFVIGVLNTLRVVSGGIVLATIVGLVVGLARLSSNWLVRTISGAYVEVVRNTPLLVQLFFWYFAVILQLPDIKNNLSLGNFAILSNRGMALGWLDLSQTSGPWLIWLGVAVAAAFAAGRLRRRQLDARGKINSSLPAALAAFVLVAALGYIASAYTARLPDGVAYELRRGDRGTLFVDANANAEYDAGVDRPMRRVPITLLGEGGAVLGSEVTAADGSFRFVDLEAEGTALAWETPAPLVYSAPILQGFNVRGGRTFSPEFTALLLGLVLYTGAFIAEIVRAGINSVSKGQWEASRAVGLSAGDTLRLIVLPQALRVIIPPLTSQFLNLTKNSSLAIAVGYPDLFNVSLTIMNQSGAAVQMFLIIMATYLSISLLTSLVMNWYNRRISLVER